MLFNIARFLGFFNGKIHFIAEKKRQFLVISFFLTKFAVMKATGHLLMMAAAVLVCWLVSCNPSSRQPDNYTVVCNLSDSITGDSATLLVLEQGYDQLRVCGTSARHGSTFTFTGQTVQPQVALLRLDADSALQYYFVLDTGRVVITLTNQPGQYRVEGGEHNDAYQQFLTQREAIQTTRVGIWQEYLRMAGDSTLKRDSERQLVQRDSVLNDSLQDMMLARMNAGDLVSVIVRQRYAHQLTADRARQLK